MEVSLKGREAIRRYIGAIPNEQWVARARLLMIESAQAFTAGKIDEATYEIWAEEVEARLERHAEKAVAHGRFEGQATSTVAVGVAGAAQVNSLPEPERDPEPLTALPPNRRRRGLSQVPVEVRRVRRLYLKGQAKLAKCPYEVWQQYDLAKTSALSIVLLDIYERGECTRSIKQIAGAAGTSRRTVQVMLSDGHGRRDLLVERRTCPETGRDLSNRITTQSAEILAYQDKLRRNAQPNPLGKPSFFDPEGIEYGSPLEGAKFSTLPLESNASEPLACPPEVVEEERPPKAVTIEIAVLEAPELPEKVIPASIQNFDLETVEDALSPGEPKTPVPFHYRPSWQPKMTAEEYAARYPKQRPEERQHHERIDDKLAASLALVQGHAAHRTASVEMRQAHRIKQPDGHAPLDDKWARLAAEVAPHVGKKGPPS